MYIVTMYYLIINIMLFLIMTIDKLKACRGLWRVSESFLLFLALLGGAFDIYLSMVLFRHKTRHKKFTIIVPLLCFFHIVVISIFYLLEADMILTMLFTPCYNL